MLFLSEEQQFYNFLVNAQYYKKFKDVFWMFSLWSQFNSWNFQLLKTVNHSLHVISCFSKQWIITKTSPSSPFKQKHSNFNLLDKHRL